MYTLRWLTIQVHLYYTNYMYYISVDDDRCVLCRHLLHWINHLTEKQHEKNEQICQNLYFKDWFVKRCFMYGQAKQFLIAVFWVFCGKLHTFHFENDVEFSKKNLIFQSETSTKELSMSSPAFDAKRGCNSWLTMKITTNNLFDILVLTTNFFV